MLRSDYNQLDLGQDVFLGPRNTIRSERDHASNIMRVRSDVQSTTDNNNQFSYQNELALHKNTMTELPRVSDVEHERFAKRYPRY